MINKEMFFDNGNLNKNKLRESWVEKNLPNEYTKIILYKKEGLKFSNILFNYLYDIKDIPICKFCQIEHRRFIGFNEGYNEFCSHSCALKMAAPQAVSKRKQNALHKWGVEHTSKLDWVKEKQENTNLERWGFKSPTLNNEVRIKQQNTMIDKYGVKFSGLSENLLNKSLQTRFEKYKRETKDKFRNLNIVNIPSEGNLEILCDKCNQIYKVRSEFLRLRYFRYKVEPCTFCNPISSYKFTSKNEIHEFLSNFNLKIIQNDREILSGKEIDLYLPEVNLAIEFNGLYWHSNQFKSKKYHLDKKLECELRGINLIHIWEDDWIYKSEIVKSRLKNVINKSEYKIYSRKCELKEIDYQTSSQFLKDNHLQSDIKSSYQIGLYFNTELVSIMTFGSLRRALGHKSRPDEYEMLRFCNKLNTNVVGSFSKLLTYFKVQKKPIKIISYLNRDWSLKTDNVYEKNGFEFQGASEPNYWYFNDLNKRMHRFNYRKDKLLKEGFVGNTEKEIMFERGFNLIYDCGSLKYEFHNR